MALTAREWLLLPKEEQQMRKKELPSQECLLLRTLLSEIHFTESEKRDMSLEKREAFLHPQKYTKEEKTAFNQQCKDIFKKMSE